jgi:Predicted hydrolases of the HAD superfamily
MAIKAIAFDLDGTLLDSDKRIRPETIDAIREVRARGLAIILVTGRHHVSTRAYHHQLGLETPAICCNGTYLYDFKAENAFSTNPLLQEEAEHLLRLVRKHEIASAKVFTADAMTYEVPDKVMLRFIEWGKTLPSELRPNIQQVDDFATLLAGKPTVWKFIVAHPTPDAMQALEQDIDHELGLSCEWDDLESIDITRAGNSKGSKLVEWGRMNGIAPSEIIAFGDNNNDTSMFRAVGLGFAMGNSADHVKAVAHKVTDGDNNSNAIAKAVRQSIMPYL